jgi:hypothetical protein
MQMTRARSRWARIASAIRPMLFSWKPSLTWMSWVTWPATHAALKAPTW